MCGRLVQSSPTDLLEEIYQASGAFEAGIPPSYNVCPGREVTIVRSSADGRRLDRRRWGLEMPKPGRRPINARAETVHRIPGFRDLLPEGRCVVPADGFYEWQREGRRRVPWYFSPRNGRLLSFAGLHSTATGTFLILTRPAEGAVGEIHDRMPVMLDDAGAETWLDPKPEDPKALRDRALDAPSVEIESWRVSERVNRPGFDEPVCIERVDVRPQLRLFPG